MEKREDRCEVVAKGKKVKGRTCGEGLGGLERNLGELEREERVQRIRRLWQQEETIIERTLIIHELMINVQEGNKKNKISY